jgi:hypothetical protein
MLKEKLNLRILEDSINIELKMKNLFIDSNNIAFCKTECLIGVIYKVDNKYVFMYIDIKDIDIKDIDKYLDKAVICDNLGYIMNYLRDVRFDHALNFEIKDLVEPMLGELYKNKTVEIRDVLGI